MVKSIVKKLIVRVLEWEAKLVLKKYRPKVIGITGSIGKTSTKDAVATVMTLAGRMRKSEKSYNSEFGVPLTILDRKSAWSSLFGWGRNLLAGLEPIIFRNNYPEWLVLEVGADRPRDIKKLVKWLRVNVAVVTAIPDIPAHIEFFPTKEHVIAEKGALAQALVAGGAAILNADDANVMTLADKFRAHAGDRGRIITYGFSKEADLRASNVRIVYNEESKLPEGLSFKVDYDGSSIPVRLKAVAGNHQVYPVLAALAVGVSQGLNMVAMAEALEDHDSPPGRLKLIPGIKQSIILDDSYNSSPAALEAALETLSSLETPGRKIALLGDMFEIGEHTIAAHKEAGARAAEFCDYIITVGIRAKFIDEGARETGYPEKKLFHFDEAEAAGKALDKILKAGDAVLVKGSQIIRLEKAVEEIMAEPPRKLELLCRQYEEWVK